METLKSINNNNNTKNELIELNVKYLDNLDESINNINTKLKDISIKQKFINEMITYLNLLNDSNYMLNNVNINENNNLLYFLLQTKQNIVKLKWDIPIYEKINNLKMICDEYYIFHNNIIKKIKKFIYHYIEFINILSKIHNVIELTTNNTKTELNNMIFNYNESCKHGFSDPNFDGRYKEKIQKIEILKKYNNYINNQINNYYSIKTESKKINISFLEKIKNMSYC